MGRSKDSARILNQGVLSPQALVVRADEEIEMKRRDFIALLGGAAAWPRALGAQQKAMPVVGYLHPGFPGPVALSVASFHHGLSEAGYVEGQNLAMEYRWAEGNYDRLP